MSQTVVNSCSWRGAHHALETQQAAMLRAAVVLLVLCSTATAQGGTGDQWGTIRDENAPCLTSGTNFLPTDMLGEARSEESGAPACQARCQQSDGCAFFTFWPDGGCHLKDASATPAPNTPGDGGPSISGPRECALTDGGARCDTHMCGAGAVLKADPACIIGSDDAQCCMLTCATKDQLLIPDDCSLAADSVDCSVLARIHPDPAEGYLSAYLLQSAKPRYIRL